MTPVAMLAPLTVEEVLIGTGGQFTSGGRHTGGSRLAEISGVSIDSRTISQGQLFFAISGPRFDGHNFLADVAMKGALAAVVHRDAPAPPSFPLLRVQDTTRALQELARHRRLAAEVPVVAITGSVGKTTTKEMTAALLATRGPVLKTEGNLNNRYGLPLSLLRLREEHTAAVLELGMSAAGELRELAGIARPDVAVITRVSPVHLEFFSSVDAIAVAKAEILEGLRPGGTAVLNGDDERLRRIGERLSGRVVWFGRDRRYEVSAESWRGTGFGMRFDLRVAGRTVDIALPLAGPHFVQDFLAAAAAAHALDVAPEAMAEAATGLSPARHRGEVVRLGEGVVLLDDCYNSSPDALEAAVVALTLLPGQRRVAVIGDMLELGKEGPALHREAGRHLVGKVDVVMGVGELAKELLGGAREAGMASEALHHFADADEAAGGVPGLIAPRDAVLVKASRGVRLEKVVKALRGRFPDGESGGTAPESA
jgi:UDP-N-acetylmuramoyl-tripeptide--D-alanyl-D-alanine ligase